MVGFAGSIPALMLAHGEVQVLSLRVTVANRTTVRPQGFESPALHVDTNARPVWDETWLDVAKVIAKRAACTRSQVGAVIVVDNKYTWLGYNGTPTGQTHCTDGGCPRGQLTYSELAPGTSYDTCEGLHAEQNALLRAGDRAVGGTLYITREPCSWCWKNIRASGLTRVVWLDSQGEKQEKLFRPSEATLKT